MKHVRYGEGNRVHLVNQTFKGWPCFGREKAICGLNQISGANYFQSTSDPVTCLRCRQHYTICPKCGGDMIWDSGAPDFSGDLKPITHFYKCPKCGVEGK